MVDFGRRNRGGLQPSRSLPMSTLNQRERSATPQNPMNQRKALPSIRRGNKDAPSTPNPYSNRPLVTPTKVRPRRAHSATLAAHQQLEKASDHIRSTSPSKYDDNPSILCCTPQECLLPSNHNNATGRRRRSSAGFGILKALLRATSLLIVGFGGGFLFNMWNASSLHAHIDLESHPVVLLNDQLVKQLAHDNQLQEQELTALKKQMEDAAQKKQEEESQMGGNKKEEEKQYVTLGKYDDNGTFQKYPVKQRRVFNGGNLRAVKRFVWDEEGHVKEVPLDGGQSGAAFPKTQENQNNNKKEPQKEQIWAEEHHSIRDGPTKQQQEAYNREHQPVQDEQPHANTNNNLVESNPNSVLEDLCIHNPAPEIQKICEAAHNVQECLRMGCKSPEAALRYVMEAKKKEQPLDPLASRQHEAPDQPQPQPQQQSEESEGGPPQIVQATV